MHSAVISISWKGYGHIPVLVDSKGEILPGPLSWLVSLSRDGTARSTLKRNVGAIKRFYDFWQQYSHQLKHEDRLRLFFKAMRGGDPNLGWKPIEVETAESYLGVVNLYLDWIAEYNGTENPNPIVERKESWHSQLMTWARRYRTDMLGHLSENAKTGLHRKFNIAGSELRRHPKGPRRPAGIFKIENFHKLIAHEESSRSIILYLLLGPGGLRISEVLHLFISDIVFDPITREARVRLADPKYGPITTKSLGKEVELTREKFLHLKYGLQPRCDLAVENVQWAGWKGMKMQRPEDGESEVLWLHSFYGQMLWKAHVDYMKQRAAVNPGHPWYLVNLQRNVGSPLTARNAASLLNNACQSLHLPPPYNPHSLRHMFGDVTANVLKLALQHVQVGLRHSSILSTMIYTEPSTSTVRAALRKAKG